jgi:hypothetical protein
MASLIRQALKLPGWALVRSKAVKPFLRSVAWGEAASRTYELVPEHRKAGGEERLLHWHEELAALGQQRIYALRLLIAVDRERQIGAAHRLVARDISSEEFSPAEVHTRVKDGVLPIGRHGSWTRLITMSHQHRDLSAEMLFVETKSLFTVSAVV